MPPAASRGATGGAPGSCRSYRPLSGAVMNATDLFKQGRLKEALDAQLQEVKAKPGDHGKRLFLFELSAFAGDLDRARRQIDAVKYDDPEQQMATEGYRKLLDGEEKRRRLFRDGVAPKFLGEA